MPRHPLVGAATYVEAVRCFGVVLSVNEDLGLCLVMSQSQKYLEVGMELVAEGREAVAAWEVTPDDVRDGYTR